MLYHAIHVVQVGLASCPGLPASFGTRIKLEGLGTRLGGALAEPIPELVDDFGLPYLWSSGTERALLQYPYISR